MVDGAAVAALGSRSDGRRRACGGGREAADADAGGAPPLMIACMTFSGVPACLSAISDSVRVSNFVGLERIFARMTLSDNPALTIWMTVSLVMTSCTKTDAVELARRHPASRREAKSSCVLNALRRATSRVIWHPSWRKSLTLRSCKQLARPGVNRKAPDWTTSTRERNSLTGRLSLYRGQLAEPGGKRGEAGKTAVIIVAEFVKKVASGPEIRAALFTKSDHRRGRRSVPRCRAPVRAGWPTPDEWNDLVRAFCRIPNEITMPDALVSDQRWCQL
jgi:hypothetical protein